jgi:recombination protein RecA
MGLQARLMSQAMRKLTGTIARTNTVCIFINQLREKIGVMFGPSETTTGGNALKFYASVRIDIRPGNAIKDGDNILGKHAKVKIVKNKVAPPFKRCEFDIMFGEGISRASEIIDLGVELGIVQKSGAWFSYNGSKLAQGRDAAKGVIDDNPELADELEAKIMEALSANHGAESKSSKIAPKSAAAPKDEALADDAEELDDVQLDEDFNEDFSLEEDV